MTSPSISAAGTRRTDPARLAKRFPRDLGLGGGAGRTRTCKQEIISLSFRHAYSLIFPGLPNDLAADFRLDFQPKKSVHAKTERTVETSVSTPVSPALPGLEVVQAPIWARTPEVQHECGQKANTLACAVQSDDRSRQFNTV